MDPEPVQGGDPRYRVIPYPAAGPSSSSAPPPPEAAPETASTAPPRTMSGVRGWSTRNKALAGIGAAVVLGLGLGAMLMPQTGGDSDKALAEATATRGSDQHLNIEVHRRPPPRAPVSTSGGKIDAASTVMQPAGGAVASSVPEQPPAKPERQGGIKGFLGRLFGGGGGDEQAQPSADAQAAASQPVRTARQAQPAPVRVQPVDVQEPQAAPTPAYPARPPAAAWPAEAQPAVQTRPAPVAGASPSFDCSAARMRSEQMVCEVPSLAAADRRMAQAYREARMAGVPSDMLREQQHRWYRARERAAVSPAAVGMVYQQRIAELESLRNQARQSQDSERQGDDDNW